MLSSDRMQDVTMQQPGIAMPSTFCETTAKARDNIAKAMFVESYSVLTHASEDERKKIIKSASKHTRKWSHRLPHVSLPWAGNPYVMLGRKINSKGKIIE